MYFIGSEAAIRDIGTLYCCEHGDLDIFVLLLFFGKKCTEVQKKIGNTYRDLSTLFGYLFFQFKNFIKVVLSLVVVVRTPLRVSDNEDLTRDLHVHEGNR